MKLEKKRVLVVGMARSGIAAGVVLGVGRASCCSATEPFPFCRI